MPLFHASPTRLAFVLGGGGARGALQVGALLALLEAGIRPDIVVGTSIGAVNGTMITVHGFTPEGLDKLIQAWRQAQEVDLLPGDYLRIAMRTMLNRIGRETYLKQMRAFFLENGITPELRFQDFPSPRLYCVATDLNDYRPYIFGLNPKERILDGVMASAAIPPWIPPLHLDKHWLMDGGALSNLPVEPALRVGATEIIALDLFDPRPPADREARGISTFLDRLLTSLEHRQVTMELALAQARGVPVHHWRLQFWKVVPVWDFRYTEELFQAGYAQAWAFLRQRTRASRKPSRWRRWFKR